MKHVGSSFQTFQSRRSHDFIPARTTLAISNSQSCWTEERRSQNSLKRRKKKFPRTKVLIFIPGNCFWCFFYYYWIS